MNESEDSDYIDLVQENLIVFFYFWATKLSIKIFLWSYLKWRITYTKSPDPHTWKTLLQKIRQKYTIF